MSYEVTTYNVGQGLFNLVIEVNDEGVSFCGIFDCGSIYYYPMIDKQAVLYDAACKIRCAGGLDCIVISHQDLDHWSWLINLLENAYSFKFEYNKWYKSKNSRYAYMKRKLGSINIFTRDRYWYDWNGETSILNYTSAYGNKDYMLMIHYLQPDNIALWNIRIETEGYEALDIAVNTKIDNGEYSTKVDIGVKCASYTKYYPYVNVDDVINILKQHMNQWAYEVCLSGMMALRLDTALEAIWNNVLNINIENTEENDLKDVWIPHVYIGGAYENDGYRHLYEFLSAFSNVKKLSGSVLEINFTGDEKVLNLNNVEDIVKCCNEAIKRNATSLVTYYVLGDNYALFFPGDATFHTFSDLLNVRELYCYRYFGVAIAPHHGSHDTNIIQNVGMDSQPVGAFFNSVCQVGNMVFSAHHKKFDHPNVFVVEMLSNRVREGEQQDAHNIVVCDLSKNVQIEKTTKCIYTTECTKKIICRDGKVQVFPTFEKKTVKKILPPDDMFINTRGVKL